MYHYLDLLFIWTGKAHISFWDEPQFRKSFQYLSIIKNLFWTTVCLGIFLMLSRFTNLTGQSWQSNLNPRTLHKRVPGKAQPCYLDRPSRPRWFNRCRSVIWDRRPFTRRRLNLLFWFDRFGKRTDIDLSVVSKNVKKFWLDSSLREKAISGRLNF
jgi:hypothetical protein